MSAKLLRPHDTERRFNGLRQVPRAALELAKVLLDTIRAAG